MILTLKCTLAGSVPPIWRRIQVPDNMSLGNLHHVIQTAMGWTDNHLHEFEIDGDSFSGLLPDGSGLDNMLDESKYRLSDFDIEKGMKFQYIYDFGDYWVHRISVEKIDEPQSNAPYPVCIGGKRACPPEDCGGGGGYEVMLEALADPTHCDHEMYVEWLGGEFDPEYFDLNLINTKLGRLSTRLKAE